MRILITGVSTSTGRDVARLLLSGGHQVRGTDLTAHRYLEPAVDFINTSRINWTSAVGDVDTVLHLASEGHGPLAQACLVQGVRVIVPLVAGRSDEMSKAGVNTLVVSTAPVVGRRADRDSLRVLAGILKSPDAWQLLHHDDLTRFLVEACLDGSSGPVHLTADGCVTRADIDEAPRLKGVTAAARPPLITSTADFEFGWTAKEALADLMRGLGGRTVGGGEAREASGRFALPTDAIPNNLPSSDGEPLVAAAPVGLQGEFDTLLDLRLSVLTATNTSEALPGPMTPLTLDLQLGALRSGNESMGRMLALEGQALEQNTSLVLGVLGHCVYINASVGVNVVENMPGWDEASVRRDAYGNIPEDVVFRPVGGPPMPQGFAARKATFKATSNVIARARKFKEEAEKINAAARSESLDAPAIAALSDAQLQTRALLWRDRLAQAWTIASIGVVLTGAAGAIHERGKNHEKVNINVEDLESARTMLAVEHLAAVLRGNQSLIDLARAGRVDQLRAQSPEFGRALDAELAVVGHRGPGECDLSNPSFSDRPQMLVTSAAGAAQQPAAQRAAVTPPTSRTGKMAAGATLARERARDGVVRYTHDLRLAAREQGRRLVDRGLLAEIDDVYYLTLDEAFTTPSDLKGRVTRRRDERLRFQDIKMPDIVVGTWQPVPQDHALEVGQSLSGIGVFPGVIEGRARVLRTSDDDIEPGEILVASVTDVGHTAMFGYAAAVVTDIGGAASHAAIVAREFAIPCVVDTKHASTSLTDGQLIRVDGAAGTVTLLEG